MNRSFAIAALVTALALTFIQVTTAPVAAGGSARGAVASSAALTGRWTITALFGKVPATPAGDISFDPIAGLINGATACNFFRGAFRSTPQVLTLKVTKMTRRACIGDAIEHERAFLDAISKTATYRIDTDRLILTATDGAPLAELIRTPDAALEGPRHQIVSYLKDGGLYSILRQTGATLTLNNGRIEGNTGCRPFTATYTLDGEELSITNVTPAQTLAPCAENVRNQDEGILAGLPDITTYDTSRNLIRLLKEPAGAAVLWITPQRP